MPEMEMAVLQVPTGGAPRLLTLEPPKPNDTFLRQILLQRPIGGDPGNKFSHRIPNSLLVNQHSQLNGSAFHDADALSSKPLVQTPNLAADFQSVSTRLQYDAPRLELYACWESFE